MEKEMVTISKDEYDYLQDRVNFLDCLIGAGVDNWEGYDEAYEMYDSEEE